MKHIQSILWCAILVGGANQLLAQEKPADDPNGPAPPVVDYWNYQSPPLIEKEIVPVSSDAEELDGAANGEKVIVPDVGDGPSPVRNAAPPAVVPANPVPAGLLEALRRPVGQSMNILDLTLQQIGARDWDSGKAVDVRLDDHMHTMRLDPFALRTPDCQLLIQDETGALVPMEMPPPQTYRGQLIDEPDSHVAASIIDGKLHMTIIRADGETWNVQPIENVVMPGVEQDVHVVYRSKDSVGNGGTCGVSMDGLDGSVIPADPPGNEGGGIAGSNPFVRCEIAFDADFEYYQANGSSITATVADIEMIMNQVGLIYQNQVEISYAETGVIVRIVEPDPYTATSTNGLLCQFMDTWNGNVSFPRDAAHLFTGKDIDGTSIGFAWIGVICLGNITNCSGGNGAYGFSQSQFTTNLTNRVQLTAHELGHNWNCCHCDQTTCSNPPIAGCGIMNSSVNGSLTFETFSDNAITAWRDNANCLEAWTNPTYVNWAYNGTETGTFGQPFNTIIEGVNAALVGGEVRAQAGNYFQNPYINKILTIRAENGTVRIGN